MKLNRDEMDASDPNVCDRLVEHLGRLCRPGDWVVNCIEVLCDGNMIQVNAIFPHILADVCTELGLRLIHISTNCVFSKPAFRSGPCTATDLYGVSKFCGEPAAALTVRCALVGPGLRNKPWYRNSLWNGVTCLALSKQIMSWIERDLHFHGKVHMMTDMWFNEYELACVIRDVYRLDIEIPCVDGPFLSDHRLMYGVGDVVVFSSIYEQLYEQKRFVDEKMTLVCESCI